MTKIKRESMVKRQRSNLVSAYMIVAVMTLLAGCYDFNLDTVEKWCDQISGENLQNKYSPSWAVFFGVSTDADAIRDDFVAMMDKAHMEKVANRSPRMAWREGTAFHLINLIEPSEVIERWQQGIEKAKAHSHADKAEACLYGTVVSLFDSMTIHSVEIDLLGQQKEDEITTIETERASRAAKSKIKPL